MTKEVDILEIECCPNCKLFLCGGNNQTMCKCGQEIDWDNEVEYKGRVKWN